MRRGWLLLFLLSIGLNLGLGYAVLERRGQPVKESREFSDRRSRRQGPGRSRGAEDARFMERRLNRLVRYLELDAAQEREFRQAHDSMRPLIDSSRRSVQQARAQLWAAYREPAAQPDSVRRRVRALASAQGRLDSVINETLLRELTVLDPEQRQRYLTSLSWDHASGSLPSPETSRHGHRQ